MGPFPWGTRGLDKVRASKYEGAFEWLCKKKRWQCVRTQLILNYLQNQKPGKPSLKRLKQMHTKAQYFRRSMPPRGWGESFFDIHDGTARGPAIWVFTEGGMSRKLDPKQVWTEFREDLIVHGLFRPWKLLSRDIDHEYRRELRDWTRIKKLWRALPAKSRIALRKLKKLNSIGVSRRLGWNLIAAQSFPDYYVVFKLGRGGSLRLNRAAVESKTSRGAFTRG